MVRCGARRGLTLQRQRICLEGFDRPWGAILEEDKTMASKKKAPKKLKKAKKLQPTKALAFDAYMTLPK